MNAETETLLLEDLRALRVDAPDDGFRARLRSRLEDAEVVPLFGDRAIADSGADTDTDEDTGTGGESALSSTVRGTSKVGRATRIGLLLVAAILISGAAAAVMGKNPLALFHDPEPGEAPRAAPVMPMEAPKPRVPRLHTQPAPAPMPPAPIELDHEAPTPMEVPKAPLELSPRDPQPTMQHAPRLNAPRTAEPLEVPSIEMKGLDPQTQRLEPEPPRPLLIPKLRPDLERKASPPRTERPRRDAEHRPDVSRDEPTPRARQPRRPSSQVPERTRPVVPTPERERPQRPDRLESTPERLRRR